MAEKSVIKSLDIFLVLILFSVCDKYVSAIDDCKMHQYSNSMNSTQMQFTKEAVGHEFALKGQFKSLHCCAKGYRSIEWYVKPKKKKIQNDCLIQISNIRFFRRIFLVFVFVFSFPFHATTRFFSLTFQYIFVITITLTSQKTKT